MTIDNIFSPFIFRNRIENNDFLKNRMKNLDIYILTSVMVILFLVFIIGIYRAVKDADMLKLVGKMFGSYIEFKWKPTSHILTILQRPFAQGEQILLRTHNYRPDYILLQDIYAKQWLYDYTLAVCKQMLGEARSKFASLAGPQGGVQLNGNDLIAQSQTEIEKLEEDLKVFNLQEKSWHDRLQAGWHPDAASLKEKEALMSLCAFYLMTQSSKRGGNSVAKFHLGNGAKLHRINWAGDLSKKGIKQSAGLMVNYLYDLDNVEDNHERFVNGEIIYSRSVSQLV